jgi:hypothetical protein
MLNSRPKGIVHLECRICGYPRPITMMVADDKGMICKRCERAMKKKGAKRYDYGRAKKVDD